jgi:regulator of protease activity HflC (stomatin/prohibitin superfamily)
MIRTLLREHVLTSLFVAAHERAVLMVNGRPTRLLGPGWHPLIPRLMTAIRLDISAGFSAATPELTAVTRGGEPELRAVADDELGLLRVDGRARTVLGPGRWALWNAREPVTLEVLSTRGTRIQVPEEFRDKLPPNAVQTVVVPPQSEGLLYVNEALVDRLGPGTHHLCIRGRNSTVYSYSKREQELLVTQQEAMSKDKVSLKLSLVVRYRVADCAVAHTQHENISTILYSDAQLALRKLVSEKTLEQLLDQRAQSAATLLDELRARLAHKGIEVRGAELRDVGVPAAMRLLLNRVIEAEKQAEANLVHRREETAATRALANTARLLENNPTLARLKELEAWKDIAARVGTVNVVASTNGVIGAVLPSASASPAARGIEPRPPSDLDE